MSTKIPSTSKPSSKPDPTERRHIFKRVSDGFPTHLLSAAFSEVTNKDGLPLKDIFQHIENRILRYVGGEVCRDNLIVKRESHNSSYYALYVSRDETDEEYNKRQASLQARRAKAILTKAKKAEDTKLAKAEAEARQLAIDKAAFSRLAKKFNVPIPSKL